MSDDYFTEERIKYLTEERNWEMVRTGSMYKLRQKDKHYMKTVVFDASDETAERFCVGEES